MAGIGRPKSPTEIAQDWWVMPHAGPALEKAPTTHPQKTALLVIDMQYTSLDPEYGYLKSYVKAAGSEFFTYFLNRIHNQVIPSIQKLLVFFRENRLPIVHLKMGFRPDHSDLNPTYRLRYETTVETGGEPFSDKVDSVEMQIVPEVQPQKGEMVIVKTTSGGFNSTNLEDVLRSMGVEALVLTGVVSNGCVQMVARDAADRGFICTVVEDACATYTPEIHEFAMSSFVVLYGMVSAADAVINKLNDVMLVPLDR